MEVLQPLIDAGKIKIVAKQNIENWKPDVAQAAMEQILTQQNNKVDAVLAMNDGTSTGVAAALASQGLLGIPLSGQDGDVAALEPHRQGRADRHGLEELARPRRQAAAKAAIELAEGKPVERHRTPSRPTAATTSRPSC